MIDFDIWQLEWIASRFGPIPIGDKFLDDRYEWQKITNGVEWPYYRFFYHLSKMLQPALVVELGGWQGTAAAHFAAGHSLGIVVTIDHHTDEGDQFNQIKMLDACNMFSNINYIRGWTNQELTASEIGRHSLGDAQNAFPIVREYGKIDILFIDSWHTYDNAMLDWEAYKPLLASPSLVICDDIQEGEVGGSPVSGMMRVWRDMPEPKFLNGNLHPGTMMGFIKV
jgi:predicted O-methyltransferase YrrM